jgi:hypothetical protein
MSTSQTIEIIVSSTGEATVQTKGFTGSACRDASKFIEQALGEKSTEQLTSEFYQTEVLREQTNQRQ